MDKTLYGTSFLLATGLPGYITDKIDQGAIKLNDLGNLITGIGGMVTNPGNIVANVANVANLSMPSLSQWLSDWMKTLRLEIAQGIYNADVELFEYLQSDLYDNLDNAKTMASLSMSGASGFANGQIYTKVMAASRDIFTPLAAVIFCLVFAWEFSQMVTQSNRTGDKPIMQITTSLIKLVICMFVITHAIDIIMFCFNLGQWASAKISSGITGRRPGLRINDYVKMPVDGEDYPLSDIFKLLQLWILLIIGRAAVYIISLLIQLKIMVWFIEFAIFAAPAAIPMSTWLNRDWSQMGMNYVRKGLALAMEGPMMLFIFGLYGALITALNNTLTSGNADFISQFVLTVGGAVLVYVSLKKVPQITSSIFSAH